MNSIVGRRSKGKRFSTPDRSEAAVCLEKLEANSQLQGYEEYQYEMVKNGTRTLRRTEAHNTKERLSM